MRVIAVVIFSLGVLATCFGLPASTKDDVEYVPLSRRFGDQPIVDTGVVSDNPFSNPFGGLFDSLEGVMIRMRQQIQDLLKRFPGNRGNSSEIPDFPLAEGLPAFPRFGGVDLGKGNTTSVTKVIDGHKVVINETEYKNEDNFGGTFFKVRIIDVKPDSSELTTEKEAESVTGEPVNRDRETINNSFENEIPKSKEVEKYDNIETLDEVDSTSNFKNDVTQKLDQEWNEISPVEIFQDNSIDPVQKIETPKLPIDLSGDIYVNELLANSGAPTNPDAEVFFVPDDPKKIEVLRSPR